MTFDKTDLFINLFSSACSEDYGLAREAMTGLGGYVYDGKAKIEGESDEIIKDVQWVNTRNEINLDNLSVNKERPIDIGKALKKFSNENTIRVIKALQEESPQTFSQLLDTTKLARNILNHALQDMKNEDLIIFKDKNYYLTNYAVILLDGLQNIIKMLEGMAGKKLFLPLMNKSKRSEPTKPQQEPMN